MAVRTRRRNRTIHTDYTLSADYIVIGIQAAHPPNPSPTPNEVKGHLCQSILGEISVPKIVSGSARSWSDVIHQKTKWPHKLI